jgi:UDP-N-acetylmuramyl pentapeptide synthase
VLGDGAHLPDDPAEAQRALSEHAARVADHLVLVTETSLATYRAGAERGGFPAAAVDAVGVSVRAAVDAVVARLGADDVALIKGGNRQRLGRVALALAGGTVRCDLPACTARIRCEDCPMLERGWSGHRVPFTVVR